ncbi:MAG: hypothetical protein DMF52_15125 [Acidobacteria bacterium]|nr:MAG: hypothetical protein DMF52_15125 [Acidobacteriota bacterium]
MVARPPGTKCPAAAFVTTTMTSADPPSLTADSILRSRPRANWLMALPPTRRCRFMTRSPAFEGELRAAVPGTRDMWQSWQDTPRAG